MSVTTNTEARENIIGDVHIPEKIHGYSAYELAVKKGFKGSLEEWLYSLNAYSIAVKNGFKGTEEEWLIHLSAYGVAVKNGFKGTEEEWLTYLSAYGIAVKNGFVGTEEEWLICLSAYGIAVKNGFVGTEQEWIASLKGEKGDPGILELHGDLDALGERIRNVADPVEDGDVVTRKYLNEQTEINKEYVAENYVDKTDQLKGNSMTVADVADPVNDTDAANKKYVHDIFPVLFGESTAVTDISDDFITYLAEEDLTIIPKVYKQNNIISGSVTIRGDKVCSGEGLIYAFFINTKYTPAVECICPSVLKTYNGSYDTAPVALYTTPPDAPCAYIATLSQFYFDSRTTNAGFLNEVVFSFTYMVDKGLVIS